MVAAIWVESSGNKSASAAGGRASELIYCAAVKISRARSEQEILGTASGQNAKLTDKSEKLLQPNDFSDFLFNGGQLKVFRMIVFC